MWNVFKVNNKNTRKTTLTSSTFSSAFIVDFEQVNVSWEDPMMELFANNERLKSAIFTKKLYHRCLTRSYFVFWWIQLYLRLLKVANRQKNYLFWQCIWVSYHATYLVTKLITPKFNFISVVKIQILKE